jgi:hypothetical protein
MMGALDKNLSLLSYVETWFVYNLCLEGWTRLL